MSISWRNKKSWFVFILGLLALAGRDAAAISSMSILWSGGSGTAGNFTVGVATNTSSNEFYFVATDGGSPPAIGQVVTVDLLTGSTVLPGAMSPTSVTTNGSSSIFGGSAPGLFRPTFFRAGTFTCRISTAAITDSRSVTVVVGAANKIVVVAEGLGMTYTPGQNPALFTGYTGSATNGQPNQPITLRVILTDVGFNKISSQNSGTVSLVSAVPQVTITPTSQLWSGGEATFTAVINEAHVNKTIDFTTSLGGVSNGSIAIAMGGPEPESVLPYPSPFNPSQGPVKFQYNLNEAKDIAIIVKDQFGQDVWRYRGSSGAGVSEVAWDGRNERGSVVAAGVYYVLLDVGGEIKSKRRFGVVK